VFKWFADRGISAETVQRNRIGAERRFFPKLQAEADCIAFPYFRDGELVIVSPAAPIRRGDRVVDTHNPVSRSCGLS